MAKMTPLLDEHKKLNAMIVDFAGWQLPLHYGSQIHEHLAVREDAGVFDVSHMASIDIEGSGAQSFLRKVLANDVDKLYPGKGLYSCMLNHTAGVLDDLIAYQLGENAFRLVVNAATTEKDLNWLKSQSAPFAVNITQREDLAMLAIQGPHAVEKAGMVLTSSQKTHAQNLKPFHAAETEKWFIARTGYTGEDGLEVILPKEDTVRFWRDLLEVNVRPIGLGARDSLRLEAGLNLYGADMDETVTPLESNLGWTVDWNDAHRDFIGKTALLKQLDLKSDLQLCGLVLLEKGVPRKGQAVDLGSDSAKGIITSGGFSPTLSKGIALARIPRGEFPKIGVIIRGNDVPAKKIKPPFVKKGKATFTL